MTRMPTAAIAAPLLATCATLFALGVFAQESTILALPGQAEGTAIGPAEARRRAKHEALRRPFIMCYHVEPTVVQGETARIAYYVTDWEHSKVRFGDTSKRFDVSLEWSADGRKWEKTVQENVASGDGAFDLPNLPRADYVFRLLARDDKGRPSRTVWGEFRVRTKGELEIKPSETVRPTVAELAARGIVVEAGDFYAIHPVDLGEIEPMRNIHDRLAYNDPRRAAERTALTNSIAAKVAESIDSEEGRRLVAAHADGYVVFAPAKDGHFIYRARDFRKVVPGARHDAAALERRAATNSVALTAYLAGLASNGVRKVVLPKATIRLSATQMLLVPSRLTLDLGGGKLKINASSALDGTPIQLFRVEDAHIVNGTLEGQYFEYDYENCGAQNPEHVELVNMFGDVRYCSFENLDVRYAVGAGTSFQLTFLENPYVRPKSEVCEWMKLNRIQGFNVPMPKNGAAPAPDDDWVPGILTSKGEVADNGEGCFTSPFRELGTLAKKRFLTVSRFLGYRGMSTLSDYFSIAFYNAEKHFISGEIGFQYHKVFIPNGAAFMRISIDVDNIEKARDCDLKAFLTYTPQDCVWRNVRYSYCRTQGLSIVDGFNMLFEDIDITRCGDESCRCASDAEDGWDGMQNMTFRRIKCHGNPNNDFTVCCGHSFVYEDCDMRFSVNQRVHSAVWRRCRIKGGVWDCLTLTRDGYKRFEDNTYDCGNISIGTPADIVARKKIEPDWELVLEGGVFKGGSADEPMTVTAGQTGRFRACTFENCILKGPANHYSDCTIGPGCTRVEK